MAEYSCSACEELRQEVPRLIINGIDDDMCASLQNDTGLNPANGHNDCTDLNKLNDCLVGSYENDIDQYGNCDWKEYVRGLVSNLWTTLKAIICAICGIWTNIHNLWAKINEIIAHINAVSYIGILTLYRTATLTDTSGSTTQVLPFNHNVFEGNIDPSVLSVTSGYNGITITNTLGVPILVETLFNCSIRTSQHMASCYIVVTRDGVTVGQTPFITPTTYDQQVTAEAFILQPNQTTTMSYYFGIGNANGHSWFKNLFYPSGSEDAHMCLESNASSDPRNQGSYFKVKVTSVVSQES